MPLLALEVGRYFPIRRKNKLAAAKEYTMKTVTVTRIINADLDTIWAQIADITLVENWHLGVKRADLLSENETGLGATRRCNFYDGTDVVEEFIGFEDKRQVHVQIREFAAPMKSFEATFAVVPTSSGATQISITMNYEMKLSIFGDALDLLVIKGKMTKLLDRVLAGLEQHVKDGKTIGKDFVVAA